MLTIVIGITYGAVVGFTTNYLMFRSVDRSLAAGKEPLKSIGGLFVVRYLVDAAAALLFLIITRDAFGLIAATLSLTIAVKVSVIRYLLRKGGKIG